LGLTLFLGIGVLATVASPLLIALYSSDRASGALGPSGVALAVSFGYWCLPQVFFYASYALLGEVLNARKVFGPFTWAPVANNVVLITSLLIFGA
ncbi:hypothetical protein FJ656_29430, partial [Schumannella luteola]